MSLDVETLAQLIHDASRGSRTHQDSCPWPCYDGAEWYRTEARLRLADAKKCGYAIVAPERAK